MTGRTDWLSDGVTVVRLDNGHKLLGDITGSGCMVGTCIAVFCAAAASGLGKKEGKLVDGDMLSGAIGGYVKTMSIKCIVTDFSFPPLH
jgi:thiamine-phosphate diphosphorylase/hydroxyethylthiazole kinase